MKKFFTVLCFSSLPLAVNAQQLVRLEANRTQVYPGEIVEFELQLDRSNSASYCGALIDKGDGSVENVRIGDKGNADFPYRFIHQYRTPGTFVVKIDGRTIVRGLKTATGCAGSVKTVSITVVDPSEIERRAEMLRKERELAEKENQLRLRAQQLSREQEEVKLRENRAAELEEQERKRRANISASPSEAQVVKPAPKPVSPKNPTATKVEGF